jgi:hypothetical protein
VIYILPVAGFVILYSDYVRPFFELSMLPSYGFLTFLQRVNLLYFGSLLVLAAYGIYRVASSPLLRSRRDLQHFITDVVNAQDTATVSFVLKKSAHFIEALKVNDLPEAAPLRDIVAQSRRDLAVLSHPKLAQYVPRWLRFFYNWQNHRAPPLRVLTFCLAIGGYALLALPAVDLFFRIVGRSLEPYGL